MPILKSFIEIQPAITHTIITYNRKYYASAIEDALNLSSHPFNREHVEQIIAYIDVQMTRNVYNSFSNLDTDAKSVADLPDVNSYSEDEWLEEIYLIQGTKYRSTIQLMQKELDQEIQQKKQLRTLSEVDQIRYEYFKYKYNLRRYINKGLKSGCPFKTMIFHMLRPVYRYLKQQG